MEAEADLILERLNRDFPGLVPQSGQQWVQYLLDWRQVMEDETGVVRRRLQEERRRLRFELGISQELVAGTGRAWDRGIALEHFWFLYEKDYYDPEAQAFRAQKLADHVRQDFGTVDAICLWQGYPRLGLDHRNQFDYLRDLPGGVTGLRTTVSVLQAAGMRCFLAYNPWDTGTRREPKSDAETLADILRATGADGVFLDTLSGADASLRETLRAARPEIAVCPELIPSLGDLSRLTGGWQQFAHPSPPSVLAHRWLDPGFCLRYVDRYARSRREQVKTAFFHGTGHVVWENVFGWWNPWSGEDRLLLKRTTALLRELSDFFRDPEWEPYVPTRRAGVYAMEWHHEGSVLFTLYNSNHDRSETAALRLPPGAAGDAVDLWSLKELEKGTEAGTITCDLEPGAIGCVLIGPGRRPSPLSMPFPVPEDRREERRHRQVTLDAYKPRPPQAASRRAARGQRDMVRVQGCRYVMSVHRACNAVMEGGSYGDISHPTAKGVPDQCFWLATYWMDRTPVTKAAFAVFLRRARFAPASLPGFLRDWSRPSGSESRPFLWSPPAGHGDHPVVWVSLEDARAYAHWAGARLPTEAEWQLAAEGPDGRRWPWGDEYDPSLCNGDSAGTTDVRAYPGGASAVGCLDMCGNVWEWTESERDDGHMRYAMVRGGSWLRVSGSIWYTASGPQPCDVHEKVPLLGAGLDRLATVGFRCVT